MRQWIGLVIGLVVGIAGATLYSQSLPPEEGSLEEKIEEGRIALEKAEKRIATLEAETEVIGRSKAGATFRDRTRSIAEDIRDGKLVDVDDVFGAFKPVMRDLSPLFDRIRLRDQKKHFDTIAGEYSRKYDLTPEESAALQKHLEKIAAETAAEYSKVITSESSSFEDFVRASRNVGREDGLDAFMESTLQGEKLEQFRTDRLTEKVERVQGEADRKVERLNTGVVLDEAQKDQVFTMMARGSRDYDPAMQFEGLTGDTAALSAGGSQSRDEAILSVLRPDQREAFEAHREKQREEAEADMRAIGLKLPENWDVFNEGDF